jgi:hypothetical protein
LRNHLQAVSSPTSLTFRFSIFPNAGLFLHIPLVSVNKSVLESVVGTTTDRLAPGTPSHERSSSLTKRGRTKLGGTSEVPPKKQCRLRYRLSAVPSGCSVNARATPDDRRATSSGGREGSTSDPSRAGCSNCHASSLEPRACLPIPQYVRQDADLLSLRPDRHLLCLNQGDQVIVRKGEKGCAVHPSPVGDSGVTVSSRILPGGW